MEANKHKVFVSFLFSYLLILLVPLLLGGLGLTEAERVVKTYAVETSQSILEQTRDTLDTRIAELRRTATLMALDPMVRSLVEERTPIGSQVRYSIWELSRNLQSYQLTETFLTTFFLYYENIEMIVSPYASCPISSFYGYSLQYGDLNLEQWKRMIRDRYYGGDFLPATEIRYEGNRYSVIPYLLTLPMGQREHPGAALIMLINEAQIKKLLAKVKVYDRGWVYVEDGEGRIVTAVSGPRATATKVDLPQAGARREGPIAGRPMTVIQTAPGVNGWRYVAVLPTMEVMGRVRYVRYLTVGVALFSLLVGLLMAYYLAYRNVKPLREIVHSLTGLLGGGIDRGETEYEVLRGTLKAISNVMTDNKSLHHAVERQKPLVKAAVMDSLLRGRYRNQVEVESALTYVGWETRGRSFTVLIIRIASYEGSINSESLKELDYIRAFIESNLTATAFSENYLHHIDRGTFAVLLGAEAVNPGDVMRELDPSIKILVDLMFRDYGLRILCALGGPCDGLLNVGYSYDQARQAADYQTIKEGNDVVWYCTLPGESVRYYYPMELEERLIYLTKVGNKQEIKKILTDIWEENFKTRELSVDMVQQFLYELRGTAEKVLDDRLSTDMRDNFRKLLADHENMEGIFQNISKILWSVCELSANRSVDGAKNLIGSINGYLRLNYVRADCCLTTTAAHFGLSPAYLSQVFKEETGENFSDFLEGIRMEHAGRLLADPALSIGDIAQQLGYNSDKVFRRAFKRVKGASPTEFRKTIAPGD